MGNENLETHAIRSETNRTKQSLPMRDISYSSNNFQKIDLIGIIAVFLSALTGTFIYYCEKLQLLPLTAKGGIGRLGLSLTGCFFLFGLLYLLLRKTIRSISGKEWGPFLLLALIISVCVMVWFPLPDTGIYSVHRLSIRAIPDENGVVRPVTLTWFNREGTDISLSALTCTGNCHQNENGVTLQDESAELTWQGMTGNLITLEFISDEKQGTAEIIWDQNRSVKTLNNPELERLSYDFSFPPSNRLPEFIAVWWITFIICLVGLIALIKMLPQWNIIKFGTIIFIIFAGFRIIQFLTVTGPLSFVDSEFYLGLSGFSVSEILHGKEYCRTECHCLSRPVLIHLVYKL